MVHRDRDPAAARSVDQRRVSSMVSGRFISERCARVVRPVT
jgi:hypothetical protein